MSVLPHNPSIAIDIASSCCSRTVTRVFAGELVELESLLVLKKKDAGASWCVFCVKFRQSDAKAVILDRQVPVLPQNLSIAIDIASSSYSRTVTTVFAGEPVELESLLVLNINLGKGEAERHQVGDSRSDIVHRNLELVKTSCQAGSRRLSLRMHALRMA